MQIYKSMILSDVIYRNPTVIPVISRFGIRLGLRDKTILEIAREHAIDVDFFILVLNTYLNEDYFPEVELQTLTAEQISEYLNKTDEYYLRVQLPNIEKHLNAFIRISMNPENTPGKETSNSGKIFPEEATGMPESDPFPEKFIQPEEISNSGQVALRESPDRSSYFPVSGTVVPETTTPETGCLPKKKGGEKNGTENHLTLLSKLLEAFKDALRARIENPSLAGNPAEQILGEMQHIMIRFLSGSYNENLCYATIFALKSMENDLKRHNRIRRRIFHPVLEAERTGRKAVSRRQAEYKEDKKLTPRELEVLTLIVSGKLNKEIADRLHISFQTVLTHRKNITAKLGIKTVSGLTFYAIMNGLVKAV